MTTITYQDGITIDEENGDLTLLQISLKHGIPHVHACGGNARCTTCRVVFVAGEPSKMTAAEKERLAAKGLSGVRLSCQILCDHDMTVRAISRLEGSGRPDPGGAPAPEITPPAVWI